MLFTIIPIAFSLCQSFPTASSLIVNGTTITLVEGSYNFSNVSVISGTLKLNGKVIINTDNFVVYSAGSVNGVGVVPAKTGLGPGQTNSGGAGGGGYGSMGGRSGGASGTILASGGPSYDSATSFNIEKGSGGGKVTSYAGNYGYGGGALFLTANYINIMGSINVAGVGGHSGSTNQYGDGGGSGGGFCLEQMTLI